MLGDCLQGQGPNPEELSTLSQVSVLRTEFLSKNGQRAFSQNVPCARISCRNMRMWMGRRGGMPSNYFSKVTFILSYKQMRICGICSSLPDIS